MGDTKDSPKYSVPDEDARSRGTVAFKKRWMSIKVMFLSQFFDSTSFTIVLTSLWAYIAQIDTDADTEFLGWAVASYSIAALAMAPIFGAMYHVIGTMKILLITTMGFALAGGALHANAEQFTSNRRYALLAAMVLMGARAGNQSLIRSYLSAATTLKERTGSMAILVALQAFGLVTGPAMMAAFISIGYPGPARIPGFYFNMYTSAGMFVALLAVANIIVLLFFFVEITVPDGEKDTNESKNKTTPEALNIPGIICCLFGYFSGFVCLTSLDTILNPLGMHMFSWNGKESSLYTGIMLVFAGILVVFSSAVVKILSKRYDDRIMLVCACAIAAVAYVILIPVGNVYPDLQQFPLAEENVTVTNSSIMVNSSGLHVYNLTNLADTTTLDPTIVPGGCPPAYDWCHFTPKLFLPQLVVSIVLWAAGSALVLVLSLSIYTKVLGARSQGIWLGVLTSAGCAARAVGPIMVAYMYERFGPLATFLTLASLLALAFILTIVCYKRLRPSIQTPPVKETEEHKAV